MELIELTEEEYSQFYKNSKYSNFMQTTNWAMVNRKRGNKTFYLGLKENSEIKCATLLIEEKLKLGFKHFLAPRGYIIDYKNIDLLLEFTNKLKKFTKKKKGIYFTMDPALEINRTNTKGEVVETSYKKDFVPKINLAGYKHRGFNDDFSSYNPRYTFEIDMNKPWEDIEKNFSKQFRKNVRKSYKYDVLVKEANKEDLKEFYELQKKTAIRNEIIIPSFEHFSSMYNAFEKDNKVKLYMASINPKKICANLYKEKKEKLEKKLFTKDENKRKELDNSIDRINKEIFKFNKYKEIDEITVSSHMVLYDKDKAYALYAGSDKNFSETFANNRVYYEKFKKAKEDGIKSFDLFGATDKKSNNESLKGIHNFKNQFGGDYVEYIGEFFKINNKLMYYLYKASSNFYRKRKRKKVIKEEKTKSLIENKDISNENILSYQRKLDQLKEKETNFKRNLTEEKETNRKTL